MNTLIFTTTEGGILVKGKTYDVKEQLKANGGRWNADANGWMFRHTTNVDELRSRLEKDVEQVILEKKRARKVALAERTIHREWLRTPEGMAHTAAEARTRVAAAVAAGSTWICCAECEVIDWQRQHSSCQVHAVDGNTFRVRGNIYTGT